MPLSVTGHNTALDGLGGSVTMVGLALCTALSADALAGDTSVDVDHAVAAGDYLGIEKGKTTEDVREVTSVSGTGPYTATLASAIDNDHNAGALVAHAPKAEAELREVSGGSYARQSITWNAASGSNLDSSNQPSFSVPGGSDIGAHVYYDSATTPVYYGSALNTDIESFGSDGTFDLTDSDVSLES